MLNSADFGNNQTDFLDTILHAGGMEVLSILSIVSKTATEVSKQTGIPLAKVNYIIKMLEKNDLVFVDCTNSKEDFVENAYKADVNSFSIRLSSKNSDEMEKIKMINYMIDEVQNGMVNAVTDQAPAEFSLVKARIPRSKVKEYIQKLRELEAEIDSHQEIEDAPYTFTVALFQN